MDFGAWLGKIDRFQQSLWFKVVASIVAVALTIGVVVTYSVRSAAAGQQITTLKGSDILGEEFDTKTELKDGSPEAEARKQAVRHAEGMARFYNQLRSQKLSTAGVTTTAVLVLLPVLAVIWLGVGLTYLALGLIGAATVWPMMAFGSAQTRGFAVFIAGALILAASFGALVQLLRMLLSASVPITAIARNVVAEAVRMKISLVFIVLLILGLSVLPGLLDPTTPLRYRVQSFLQYATTGTYWVTAVLMVTLACASVCFEQRDKIIWQTMTKPVRSIEFVLGKWLGVAGLGAVLVGVSCTGIFFFTDYLRRTGIAVEEVQPYVPADRGRIVTEDRLVLESQVLVGRVSERPRIPEDLNAELGKVIERRLAEAAKKYEETKDPNFAPDENKIRSDASAELLQSFLSIAPGGSREFTFMGMQDAANLNMPLTLRYKVNIGASNPTDFGVLSFYFKNGAPLVRRVPAGQLMSMPLPNSAIELQQQPDGRTAAVLGLTVINGDVKNQQPGTQSVSFPVDGLEVSFAVSGFESNFLRSALVMWVKLAMLAMVAVVCSTFLAFPVASLVSFGVLLMAEGAGALSKALEFFSPADGQTGEVSYWKYPVQWIATPVANIFKYYSDLDPTGKLVEGRLVSWGDVGAAVVLIGGVTALLAITGGAIFRSRELATYSGQ